MGLVEHEGIITQYAIEKTMKQIECLSLILFDLWEQIFFRTVIVCVDEAPLIKMNEMVGTERVNSYCYDEEMIQHQRVEMNW